MPSADRRETALGQGAGIAENNLAFVYEYVDQYAKLCLAMNNCLENSAQADVLQKIVASMPEERRHAPQIGFKSQIKDGIFFVDGKVRAGLTWPEVGAPIYFNLDEIYWTDSHNEVQGISLETAVQLLVHELGHHHGITNHDWLDHLGALVAHTLDGRVTANLVLSPDRTDVSATTIYFDPKTQQTSSTEVFLMDRSHLFDLSPTVLALPWCASWAGSKLEGLELWNFIWLGGNSQTPRLVGYAKPFCRTPQGSTWSLENFGVQIPIGVSWSQELGWSINPKSVMARIIPVQGMNWRHAELIRQQKYSKTLNNNLQGGTYVF